MVVLHCGKVYWRSYLWVYHRRIVYNVITILVQNIGITTGSIVKYCVCVWRIFLFLIFTIIGVIIAELKLNDPVLKIK